MAKKKNNWLWILIILGIIFLAFFIAILALAFPSLTPKIGIIEINGPITVSGSDSFFSKTVSAKRIIDEIKEAENDPSIEAILLDIDSPGGSVVASRQIAYAVRDSSKPVVAYINDIGTSGAYYIASASDLVIADRDSLTGSIGVIMELENYAGLLKKIGIDVTTLKKGKFKDIANPTRLGNMTDEERKILEGILDQAYNDFKHDLLEFRGDRLKAPIDEIADGRPMTGYQAWKLGLVDELGTRDYAIKRAWELAGQTGEPKVKEIKKEEFSLLDLISRAGYSFANGMLAALEKKTVISY